MKSKQITALEINEEEPHDIIQMEGINSKGFGILPKMLMQDERLSVVAKAIYAYFCSYAGAGQQAFPRISKIIKDLNISKNTYYKHFNQLRDCGYIKAEQQYLNGRLANNIYTLIQVIARPSSQCTPKWDTEKASSEIQCTKKWDTAKMESEVQCTKIQDTEKWDTYNNNINKKQQYLKNNNDSLSCQSSQSLTDKLDITNITNESIENEINVIIGRIKEKIGYKELQNEYPFEVNLLEEIVSVITDVLVSDSPNIRIEGEDKPRELVKYVFLRLTYDHIDFTIKQFKSFSGKILRKRQYLITMLYNSYHELDAHYINEVKSDSG